MQNQRTPDSIAADDEIMVRLKEQGYGRLRDALSHPSVLTKQGRIKYTALGRVLGISAWDAQTLVDACKRTTQGLSGMEVDKPRPRPASAYVRRTPKVRPDDIII